MTSILLHFISRSIFIIGFCLVFWFFWFHFFSGVRENLQFLGEEGRDEQPSVYLYRGRLIFLANKFLLMTTSIPLKRVVLFKHGLGYFERIGKVNGDDEFKISLMKKKSTMY